MGVGPFLILIILRFYQPLYYSYALRGPYLSLFEERYGRKTNQRAPKPPFGIWLFIRGFGGETCGLFYVFARVQLTRFRPVRGVCKHTVSTDSIVLHVMQRNCWNLKNNRPDLWSAVGWLRKSCCFSEQCSTQRQGDKRSAAADLIASHAPLRARRKSPWGKAVRTQHVRMARNITPGIQRGPPTGAPPKPNEVGLVGRGGATE